MDTQREGWLGEDYVRIYAAYDRRRIARLYDFEATMPGYELWGSWGLDALCLHSDGRFYVVDWIPLQEIFRREKYPNLAGFERDMARLEDAPSSYEFFQKEVHFVTPIVFGGNPTDAPVMLDQNAHAETCRFWNQTYAKGKK